MRRRNKDIANRIKHSVKHKPRNRRKDHVFENQLIVDTAMLNLSGIQQKELRLARLEAHKAFDPIWETLSLYTRASAYFMLAKRMGLSQDECHMRLLDYDQCMQVIKISNEIKAPLLRKDKS